MAITRYTEIINLIRSSSIKEAEEKVFELLQVAFDLREENISLRSKIREMEYAQALRDHVHWESPYYWKIVGDHKHGPYCQPCFDKDGKLVRLQEAEKGMWYCYVHKCTFTDKNFSKKPI